MRGHHRIHLILCVVVASVYSFAGTAFKATTTLMVETSNNTSAANTFTSQTNGNFGATNISKVPFRTLLYPGSTARIYAGFQPWFGFGDHMVVGYTSNDATQVQKQVTDMISRGLDGAIIDWYGQGTFKKQFVYYDQASQAVMHESELHAGFNFALMHDAVALKACAATAGCDVTQTLINDLTYAYNTYENSPAYLRYDSRPLVYFFGHESYIIDWNRVRASAPGNPMFIFRNPGGFNYAQSNGAFSWIAPETVSATDPTALGYLDYFDKTAVSLLPAYAMESAYKGFNDTLAAWGANRIIGQQCGQTWLQSMAESGKYYSSARQMLGVQIVTWNDYEEGSEIESGIDNCVSVTASANGGLVSWSITGQANTIDHYTIFLSQDGENLMWLADLPASASSLDLAQFALNSGSYTAFVKAVGKPSLTNKLSAGVPISISNLPPVAVLSVTPTLGIAPVTVTASTAGSSDADGTIASTAINFGDGSASVNASSATHVYSVPGTYTVSATVTDNLGASSTATSFVVVKANQPPVAVLSVTPASGIAPVTVTASTAGSSDPDGTIASTVIDFGDGSASVSASSATHIYNTPGTYTVSATVADNLGASSTATASVVVNANQPPVAVLSVTPASGIAPVTVTASTAGSSDADGTIASTVINFGDGSASVSASSATHVYSVPGSYTVTATVTDNLGASSSTTAVLMVAAANKPPIAILSLSSTSGYGPLTITASTATSSDPDGTVVSSSINFGDGASASGPSAIHTYANAGSYIVMATVIDNAGASSSTTATVIVKAPEVMVSSPSNGITTNSPVHVVASGFSGYPVTSMQIYADGVLVSTVYSPSLDTTITLNVGSHALIVKGWDSSGRSFMQTLNLTIVNQPPIAVVSTSAASLLVGGSITASTAGSSDPDGTITSISIDFGDGAVVNAASASHQYKAAGTFTVKATVTDNLGASSTASTTVQVKPQFVSISSPAAGQITTSSVQVTGTSNSGYVVTATQVYLDGVLKYQTSASSVNTTISISSGTHVIVVQGWDASGATFKSQVSVTR